jgi:hypothetical protein
VGTPLVFYMYVSPPFAHAVSAFSVASFVVAWLHVRRRWSIRGFAVLGVLAALMTMVREQDAFVAAGPAVDFALTLAERGARLPGRPTPARLLARAAAGAAFFALAFTPQALAYVALNGHVGPAGVVTRKMSWTSPHALQVLLSPEHGFLAWTPLVVLSLAGLAWLALGRRSRAGGRKAPDGTVETTEPTSPLRAEVVPDPARVAGCLLIIVASQIYIAGSVESWTVAGAFGQRRFVALTVVLVIGLAALLVRARTRLQTAALGVVVAAAVWWNIALAVQFGSGLMDRQRLELGRNAYAALVVVPRMLPDLAYRYMFSRASFYQRHAPPGSGGGP